LPRSPFRQEACGFLTYMLDYEVAIPIKAIVEPVEAKAWEPEERESIEAAVEEDEAVVEVVEGVDRQEARPFAPYPGARDVAAVQVGHRRTGRSDERGHDYGEGGNN
jgi:hypothetical protein